MSGIVLCSCTTTGWEICKFLSDSGIKIDQIVSVEEEMAQRLNISNYKSLADISELYDMPIYYANEYSMNNEIDLNHFKDKKYDLMIICGWQRLVPENILDTLKIGGIGIHGSSEFLPKNRGRSPQVWSLIEGKKQFIMQYFLVNADADDGDLFHHKIYDINYWDTIKSLYYKNSIVTKRTLLDWIPKLMSGDFRTTPQKGEPTYYPKRNPEDGKINWDDDMLSIYNFVRAQTKPYPGAFSLVENEKYYIWKCQPFDSKIEFPLSKNGEIVETFLGGDILIKCKDGSILVTESEGSKPSKGHCLK